MQSSSDPAEAGLQDWPDLKTKLTWLSLFRVFAASGLLLALAIRRLLGPPTELSSADVVTFALVGLVYLLTLGYGFFLRRGKVGPNGAYVQVIGDVVLASGVVFLTGAGESPFTFTYSIAVIAAAVILYQRGALVAAGASAAAFVGVVLVTNSGALSSIQTGTVMSPARLAFVLTSNAVSQFLVAVLTSYLARQVKSASGRVQAREERIQQLVDLQNQIVAAMPSGLVTFDADGKVTFVNPVAAAILGVGVGGAQGVGVESLLPGVSRFLPETRRAELTVAGPRDPRVLGLTVTPLEGRSGATLVVFQDLTELRRTEEQLRVSDHLASLGKLSAQLAHEIRNPLASMRGAAQLLAQGADAEPSTARLSGILMRESDRLSSLVEDFLRFARPPPPKLQRIELGSLLQETVDMLKTDPLAQNVTLEVEPVTVEALGDTDQLRQVLINLIRNALVATQPSGRVRVSAAIKNGQPQFSVWDSAGKIPQADLLRIFEPFYTTRDGGTGLGLSTAHSIVRSHGGTISVSSAPAFGTQFVVALRPPDEVLTYENSRG